MIATGDARNILFRDCEVFGLDRATSWNTANGKVKTERIVIVTPAEQSQSTYWEECYIPVNFCVPDLKNGKANQIRIDELERVAKKEFKNWRYGVFDGTPYKYRYESIYQEVDTDLGCHYVYVRILFKVLNTI